MDQEQVSTPEMDQSQEVTEAPQTEASSEFDLSQLPEEARGWLERREKEMQGDYTRKTQTLAEQRKEIEPWLEWAEALQQPETRAEALQALAEVIPPDEYLEAIAALDGEDYDEDSEGQLPDEVQWLLQKEQEREEQREEQELVAFAESFHEEIQGYAKEKNLDLSDSQTLKLFDLALVREMSPQEIVDDYLAERDELLGSYRDAKTNVPAPPVKGSTGTNVPDLTSSQGRVREAMRVANERLGGR